jgi:hypothetical protein
MSTDRTISGWQAIGAPAKGSPSPSATYHESFSESAAHWRDWAYQMSKAKSVDTLRAFGLNESVLRADPSEERYGLRGSNFSRVFKVQRF